MQKTTSTTYLYQVEDFIGLTHPHQLLCTRTKCSEMESSAMLFLFGISLLSETWTRTNWKMPKIIDTNKFIVVCERHVSWEWNYWTKESQKPKRDMKLTVESVRESLQGFCPFTGGGGGGHVFLPRNVVDLQQWSLYTSGRRWIFCSDMFLEEYGFYTLARPVGGM